MAEPQFSMSTDDDLPRTLRREKEAREREARERDPAVHTASQDSMAPHYSDFYDGQGYETDEVSVRYLQIPFFHLMIFFIKATFAAIPALIILGAMLYGAGQILKIYFPWLIQAEILIRLPNS